MLFAPDEQPSRHIPSDPNQDDLKFRDTRKQLFVTSDEDKRRALVEGLARVGDDESSILLYLSALEDPSRDVRVASVQALVERGGPELINDLRLLLKDRPLQKLEPRSSRGNLRETIEDIQYFGAHCEVARALGAIGSSASPAVEDLLQLTSHSNFTIRWYCSRAIRDIVVRARLESNMHAIESLQEHFHVMSAKALRYSSWHPKRGDPLSLPLVEATLALDPERGISLFEHAIGRRFFRKRAQAALVALEHAVQFLPRLGLDESIVACALVRVFEQSEGSTMRRRVAYQLGELRDSRALIPLSLAITAPTCPADLIRPFAYAISKIISAQPLPEMKESLKAVRYWLQNSLDGQGGCTNKNLAHAALIVWGECGSCLPESLMDIVGSTLGIDNEIGNLAVAIVRQNKAFAAQHIQDLLRALDSEKLERTYQALCALQALGPHGRGSGAENVLLRKIQQWMSADDFGSLSMKSPDNRSLVTNAVQVLGEIGGHEAREVLEYLKATSQLDADDTIRLFIDVSLTKIRQT